MAKRMSPAQKAAFVKRMAAGRRRAGKTTSRKRNPTTTRRSRAMTKAMRPRRRKNPTMYQSIDWADTAKTFAGVGAGAFVGYAVADFIGKLIINKLPASIQGIGYAVGGAGIMIAGHILQKDAKGWPITPAAAAIAAPFALRSFASYNVLPLGVEETAPANGDAPMAGMGYFGRRMSGRKKCYQIPMQGSFTRNPMQGSFARNPMQGSMIQQNPFGRGMGGSFMDVPAVPRNRGGHGGTL